jgi:hypothetical protein
MIRKNKSANLTFTSKRNTLNNLLSTKKFIQILSLLFIILTSIPCAIAGGDFDIYLDAACKLSEHMNIYAPPFAKGLQYYYSPFFAWILMPFCKYTLISKIIWLLLSYALLYRTFKLLLGYFDITLLTNNEYKFWILSIALLSYQFIMYNVSMIQITFFLMWAIFESINQFVKGKYILGGSILGLAINIKLMPILILPFLFYRGYFKALVFTMLTFIALLFVPAISLGKDFNLFLLSEWWAIINPGNKEHLFETGIGTHSLVALLPVYLTETIGELEFKRNLFNLDHQTVELIINTSRFLILALSIVYLRSMPFKKENNKLKSFWEISYFVLIIPLLLPHQQKYAFILAVPMISYLLYFFITTGKAQKTKGYYLSFYAFLVCALFYTPLYGSDVLGYSLFNFTQHYRLLSISTILFIPLSIFCNPLKLIEMNDKIRYTHG